MIRGSNLVNDKMFPLWEASPSPPYLMDIGDISP